MMYIIGLTGNIASGKSAVSKRLHELGARVVCADAVARKIVLPQSEGARRIREAFGPEVFLPDGSLDRKALGQIVFNDEASRKRLDALLHPLIIREINETLKSWRKETPDAIAVVDAALLIETGMHQTAHEVWLVEARDDIRRKRIMQRDGLSASQARARIRSQMSSDEKKRFAHRILTNNESTSKLLAQVDALWAETKARISGK
ncbi:MAG: dephospho-CoA kinase [Bacillota bacterium]